MMVTRSAPVCGLTNPSGPERFRFETHHGDYRTEHAAISSRGAAPAVTFSRYASASLCRHDRRLVLAQGADQLLVALQMRVDQFRRRERQPLIEGYIGVVVALEDLQKTQRRVAGIFDIVAHGERHKADIVGLEVKRAGLTRRPEHAHPRLPRS